MSIQNHPQFQTLPTRVKNLLRAEKITSFDELEILLNNRKWMMRVSGFGKITKKHLEEFLARANTEKP